MKTFFQGFVPGMFGVSHGALQFMTYEEMKNKYNQYRNVPIDTKMVSRQHNKLSSSIANQFRVIDSLIAFWLIHPCKCCSIHFHIYFYTYRERVNI